MSERQINVQREVANGVTKRIVFGGGETMAWPPTERQRLWRIKGKRADGTEKGTTARTEAIAIERGLEIHRAVTYGSVRSLQPTSKLLDHYEKAIVAPMVGTDQARYAEAQTTSLNLLRYHRGPNGQPDRQRPRTPLLNTTAGRFDNLVLQPAIDDVARTRNAGGLNQIQRNLCHIWEFGRNQKYLATNQDPNRGVLWEPGKTSEPRVGEAGEDSRKLRDDEVPDHRLVHALARAFAERYGTWWYELQVLTAAYGGGPRFAEQTALRGGRILVPGNPLGLLNDRSKSMTTRAAAAMLEEHPYTLRIWSQVMEVSSAPVSGPHAGQRMWEKPPKGSKRRWAFMFPETPLGVDLHEMWLRRLAELDSPTDLVFPTWTADGKYPWAARSGWDDRLVEVKKDVGWDFDYHALRDTYATTLLNDLNIPPSDAIIFTGHTDAATFFQRYVGTRPTDVEKRAVAAFSARRGSWGSQA